MNFEIQGKLFKKMDTEQKTSTFQTRNFVLLTEEQYPQHVQFQLVQDKCSIIDSIPENDNIKVSFNLRGREWQGKFLTNLTAWRVERLGAQTGNEGTNTAPPTTKDEPFPQDTNWDDLPF